MSLALVLFWLGPAGALTAGEREALGQLVRGLPALDEALVFTPSEARDAYVDDGAPPPLGLQLHFPALEPLEEAAAGGLADLAAALPSLAGTRTEAQAFWRRTWPVPGPTPPARGCSYVVHYPGPADDPDAWHARYIAGHVPLFQRLPGIRAVEIMTPVDWICRLPVTKVRHMQRNRVMFDSPAALTAALQSPVRHELRAEFGTMPPFSGGNAHYPMWTDRLVPA